MKKREFLELLAAGGAMPLMLAGCGGDKAGSAPVRLVNASVDYPKLGFMDDTTQAVTDIAYGTASAFVSVQAGTVTTSLTVNTGATNSTVSTSTRSLNKDARYSLVAYGFVDELKSVLITESTTTPDNGNANINVLNTSADIGPVDVYVSPGTDLSLGTLIASSVNGVAQSVFTGVSVASGPYYITVVGANSIAKGLSDVRFQTPTAVTLKNLQVLTVILTPGASGVLANAILLTQGTTGTATSFLNTTARVRAVAATGNSGTVSVAGVLPTVASPNYSNYVVVPSGAAPAVQANGAPLPSSGTLKAGGDYTLLVYLDAQGNPTSSLVLDDNTVPVTATGVKTRLINLVYNTANATNPLLLSMKVNNINTASNIAYAAASPYTEVSAPSGVSSVIEVYSGASSVVLHQSPLAVGNIFTEIVVGVGNPGATGGVTDFFEAAASA
ncbi:MAG: DUF4397 domain-containing protein [Burkholderiaceae bacterium]